MSFGIVEVIQLLLGLSGLGVQPNPKAPTPDAALEYAMPDAELVVHLDLASLVPGNYKVLSQLADQPSIKGSPELAHSVRDLVAQVEGGRGMVQTMIGFDPVNDVWDATGFLRHDKDAEPSFVLAVHGKFSVPMLDKMAAMKSEQAQHVGAAAWLDGGAQHPAIAVTKDGVLLVGTRDLVKARIDAGWRMPAHAAGSTLGYAAEVIANKAVAAVVVSLSQTARAMIEKSFDKPNFLTDLVKRHKMTSIALYRDGIAWSWIDSTAAGLSAMAQIADGVVDVMRASQIAPRGIFKIALGALESYRGDKRVDTLIAHRVDLENIVATYIGDGKFQSTIKNDPKTMRLDVRLTGKTLSEVTPFGVLLGVGAGAMFFMLRSEHDVEVMSAPALVPAARPIQSNRSKAPTSQQHK